MSHVSGNDVMLIEPSGQTEIESWRLVHFGTTGNTGSAADSADPDGDGNDNFFEFVAGTLPINGASKFTLNVQPVPGQPTQKQVVFDPLVAGRSYTVMTSPDLSPGSWDPLSGGSASDASGQRTVTDTNASETKKFYLVKIGKP